MPPIELAPVSRRYLSFPEREDIVVMCLSASSAGSTSPARWMNSMSDLRVARFDASTSIRLQHLWIAEIEPDRMTGGPR
jgi:hypothetical protein